MAAVYCVIIGFALWDKKEKRIFEYSDIRGEPIELSVQHVNPYLVDAPDVLITNRSKPICNVPRMIYGSKPTDGGNFLLSDEEYQDFIQREPQATAVIKPFISAKEFLNGKRRWVIWLVDVPPETLRSMPLVRARVEAVQRFRGESKASSTRDYPYHNLFRQVTQPGKDHVVIPRHSSENRKYIPMGFFTKDDIVADSCLSVEGATFFHFGMLTSRMHMAWMRTVCGRLKSDYRYSKDIVYNNFAWPEVSQAQQEHIASLAQEILDARGEHSTSTLADLYDPFAMPPDLRKAHEAVDRYVDRLYRKAPFDTDADRVALLFKRYQELTAGMS